MNIIFKPLNHSLSTGVLAFGRQNSEDIFVESFSDIIADFRVFYEYSTHAFDQLVPPCSAETLSRYINNRDLTSSETYADENIA